jgi:hypothetical protein
LTADRDLLAHTIGPNAIADHINDAGGLVP